MAQLVETLLFKDTGTNSSIVNTGSSVLISSPNNIDFITSGSINFNNTIDCSSNIIDNVVNMDSVTNTDITLSTQSTQTLNFRTAGTTNRLSVSSGGGIAFAVVPDCAVLPTLNTEFINFNTFTNIQTSYTPAIQVSSGVLTVTYNERRGRYIQFGNLVYFTAYVYTSNLLGTVPGADVRCTLPVNLPNGGFICPLSVGYYTNLDTATNVATITAQIDDNATSYFTLYKKIDGAATGNVPLNVSNTTNTFLFIVSGAYYLF